MNAEKRKSEGVTYVNKVTDNDFVQLNLGCSKLSLFIASYYKLVRYRSNLDFIAIAMFSSNKNKRETAYELYTYIHT